MVDILQSKAMSVTVMTSMMSGLLHGSKIFWMTWEQMTGSKTHHCKSFLFRVSYRSPDKVLPVIVPLLCSSRALPETGVEFTWVSSLFGQQDRAADDGPTPPSLALKGLKFAPLSTSMGSVAPVPSEHAWTSRRSSLGSYCGTPRSMISDTDMDLTSLATEDSESIMDEIGALWGAHVMERGDLESTCLPSPDECRGLPLQLVMDQCLWERLSKHCQAVSRRCVSRFFEVDGLNLQGYVMALDRLFLMSHRDLIYNFNAKLFDLLRQGGTFPSSSQATEWLHRSLVTASHLSQADEMTAAIFLQSFPGGDKPALDFLTVEVLGAKHAQEDDDGIETDDELEGKSQGPQQPEGKRLSCDGDLFR